VRVLLAHIRREEQDDGGLNKTDWLPCSSGSAALVLYHHQVLLASTRWNTNNPASTSFILPGHDVSVAGTPLVIVIDLLLPLACSPKNQKRGIRQQTSHRRWNPESKTPTCRRPPPEGSPSSRTPATPRDRHRDPRAGLGPLRPRKGRRARWRRLLPVPGGGIRPPGRAGRGPRPTTRGSMRSTPQDSRRPSRARQVRQQHRSLLRIPWSRPHIPSP
jgi:hypothetical protein